MAVSESTYRAQVLEELEKIPVEYQPSLVKLMQAFREGVAPKEAAETFSQGWQEALAEQTRPLSELWEGVDAE